MISAKKAAKIVGVLFILAAVTAVIGSFIFYDPILNGANYLIKASENDNQLILGALMELILVVSAVGTATQCFQF